MAGPMVRVPVGLEASTSAGRTLDKALARIGGSSDASWLRSVQSWLPANKGWVERKFGPYGYQKAVDATASRLNELRTKGSDALPATQPSHPFEAFFTFLNRPTEAALGYLDAVAKSPYRWSDFSSNPKTEKAVQQMEDTASQAAARGIEGKTTNLTGGKVIEDLTGWRPHGGAGGVALAVLGTGLEGVTNPLSYIPLGDVVRPLAAVAKPVARALAEQGVVDTSRLSPEAAAAVERAMGKAHDLSHFLRSRFVRYAGMTPRAAALFRGRDAATRYRIQALQDAVKKLFGDYHAATGHAVTEEILQGVTHHVEDRYYRPWLLKQGVRVPKGTQFAAGTAEADLAEGLHQLAQDVTTPEVGLGLRAADVPGYVRHLNLEYRKPGMYGTLGGEAQGMLHAQEFKRARTLLNTVEHMNRKGGNWEANWLLSMGPRLEASIRSQETQRLIEGLIGKAKSLKDVQRLTESDWRDLAQAGLEGVRKVNAKDWAKLDFGALRKAGLGVYRAESLRMFPQTVLRNGVKYLEHDAADIPSDTAPDLVEVRRGDIRQGVGVAKGSAYIMPSAVADELRTTGRMYARSGLTPVIDAINQAWKWGMTRLPFFHLHNILYNAWLGDGGMLLRRRFYAAISDVAHPEESEIYQRALRSGAVSDWAQPLVRQSLERDRQTMEAIARLGGRPPTAAQRVAAVFQDALWKTDKVMRVSLFRKALEHGMSDARAAAFVNHFMVDYQDLAPFERDVMRTLFPFYAWQRHNLPLQFSTWFEQTGKQMLPVQLVQNLNAALAGGESKPGAPYDVLIPTGVAGNDLALNLNLPTKDVQESLDEPLLAFGFARSNPLLQLGVQFGTNQENPAQGYGSYGQVPIYNPTLPPGVQKVPLAGAAGPLVDPRWQLAANALGSPIQAVGLPLAQFTGQPRLLKDQGTSPAQQALLQALGFYPGVYNPTRQAYIDAYLRELQVRNLSSAIRRYIENTGLTPSLTP